MKPGNKQIKVSERRIAKSIVIASMYPEIGDVVEEQVLFGLDIVSN
jgi:hypothetical protein